MSSVFEVYWGADLEHTFVWPNGAGGAADLTGWNIVLLNVSPELGPLLSAQIAAPAFGQVTFRVAFSDALEQQKVYRFRLQITNGQQHDASNLIGVRYE